VAIAEKNGKCKPNCHIGLQTQLAQPEKKVITENLCYLMLPVFSVKPEYSE
jgi:hypothetical protein